MKHIISIHLIVLFFSAICAYFLFYNNDLKSDPYIVINKKKIGKETFERSLAKKPYYLNEKDFMDQYIETELLVQEAVKGNLHQNSEFKEKVKSFYEKNLVQLLMEKKLNEFQGSGVKPELLNRFMKNINFSVKRSVKGESGSDYIDFASVKGEIQYRLLISDKGEVCTENRGECYSVTDRASIKKADSNEDKIKKRLLIIQSRYLWNQWLNGIKKDAHIRVKT